MRGAEAPGERLEWSCLRHVGELLRSTRERHDLTQARLARRIGTDRAYVSRVEGGASSPTFDWATRAMAAMGEES